MNEINMGNRAVATASVKTQIIHDPIPPLTWNDAVAWCESQWKPKQKHQRVYCKRGRLAEAFYEAQITIYTAPDVDVPFRDKPVWDNNTRWIAVYWVVGASEGYYIHVERIMRPADEQGNFIRRWAMVGKVYTIQQAILVTTALQTFINGRMN